ncbi:MAG: hypothetical protein NTY80_03705 [candidate division SR1 bacterium]|nr:hypothetical protein [candidate division SR1 bacterium]
MKKLLFILSLGLSSLVSAQTSDTTTIHNYGDSSILRLLGCQNIHKDTLIFEREDTISNIGWEWGFFIPRTNVLYVQNLYYKITVDKKSSTNHVISVFKDYHSGHREKIPSHVAASELGYWIGFVLLLGVHYLLFFRLKWFLFKINRRARHVPLRRKFIETIVSILVIASLSSFFGWYIHSYFFVTCPVVYFIFFLIPSGRWYIYFSKKSERRLGI